LEDSIRDKILLKINQEVQKKVAMKKGYRKKIKKNLERIVRKILLIFFTFNNVKIKEFNGSSNFGCDEYGRDVEDGLCKYVGLLKKRGLNVHTVILLGSRVKGVWTPMSDVDVTIIASNLPEKGRNILTKRLSDLRRKIIFSDQPLCLGIEPCVFSKEEFLESLERFEVNVLDAVFYGHIIYDDGFWSKVKEKYLEIEKKYGLREIPLREQLKAV
jgi:predicted nucleotidyltransferase